MLYDCFLLRYTSIIFGSGVGNKLGLSTLGKFALLQKITSFEEESCWFQPHRLFAVTVVVCFKIATSIFFLRQLGLLGRERSTLPWSYKSFPEAYETLDSSHTPFAPINVTTAPKKWIVQLYDSPRDACVGNRNSYSASSQDTIEAILHVIQFWIKWTDVCSLLGALLFVCC